MKTAALSLILFASWTLQDPPKGQCRECHSKEGGHSNAVGGKCGKCGAEATGCCGASHCYDGVCRTCGKKGASELGKQIEALGDAAKRDGASKWIEKLGRKAVPDLKAALGAAEGAKKDAIQKLLDTLDWPEGGKIVDGLQVTVKVITEKVKIGGTIEWKVRIANTTDKDCDREFKKHSPGWKTHLQWAASLDKKLPTIPIGAACCPASHVGEPGTIHLKIGAGKSEIITVSGEPDQITKIGKDGKTVSARLADEAGEWTLRVTETLTGLISNYVTVTVEK